MRVGNQGVWCRYRPCTLSTILVLGWLVAAGARFAQAQSTDNRTVRPHHSVNNSVRSNRIPRLAQLPTGPDANVQSPNRNSGPERPGSSGQPQVGANEELQPPIGGVSGTPQFRVPLQEPDFQNMRIKSEDGLVSLVARNATIRDILTLLAETQGLNVVTADPLSQTISVTLERVQLNDALEAVLSIAGYTFTINRNIILVSSLNNASTILPPQAQGLRLEVFQLDYVMAQDVSAAVTGMLSPVGHSYVVPSSPTENRRSREIVAVNDLPQFLDRVRQYIAQVDIPPRQVLIEVHVLQVNLDDQNHHGINLQQLFNRSMSMPLIDVRTTGFANTAPTQAFTFRFNDGNLTAFLEMLRTQTDSKTLASPRIMVLNGQLARMQVGSQLGFRVTTTTETSTTESVDFLDVGVVLEVTPRISADGKIMMSIRPEVSSGSVNPTTGLPEQDTTELETDILLCDHEGIMIGGLIQETDEDLQSKVAWIGDLPYVGRLFQRRATTKTRREIIFTLIPRLLPYESNYVNVAQEMYERTDTPLLFGPLHRVPRPWEPRMPDAVENPVLIRLPHVHDNVSWQRCQNCGRVFPGDICPYCVISQPGGVGFQREPPIPPQMNPDQGRVPNAKLEHSGHDGQKTHETPPRVEITRLPPISQ